MIALVDYGAGNLASVRKALAALGAEFVTPREPAAVAGMRGIIVPGVGHFDATRTLDDAWRQAIRTALDNGSSLFGICLGMQWLFDGSEEAPDLAGLGVFPGTCTRIRQDTPGFKVPHVGWNSLDLPAESALTRGVPARAQVYFTHSYAAPVVPDSVAITTYGSAFSAAVARGRVAGVQFHPEKSGDVGLRILENWLASLRNGG